MDTNDLIGSICEAVLDSGTWTCAAAGLVCMALLTGCAQQPANLCKGDLAKAHPAAGAATAPSLVAYLQDPCMASPGREVPAECTRDRFMRGLQDRAAAAPALGAASAQMQPASPAPTCDATAGQS